MEITNFGSDASWYEPDYADNRELPENKRMSVLIEPMTRHEVRRAEEGVSKVRAGSRKASVNFAKKANEMRDKILIRCLKRIEGLTEARCDADGNVISRHPVEDVETLIRVADDDLLNDIGEAIRDGSHLARGIRGNSKPASASSSQLARESGTGDAADAGVASTPVKTTCETQEVASESSQASTSTLTQA